MNTKLRNIVELSGMYTSIGWLDSEGKHTALIKDWQGNVRAAWHEGDYAVPEGSAPIQRNPAKLYTGLTGYYPYGLPWGAVQCHDRHLYSAKELERASGLLLYDFHARQYDPQLCRFTAPDPLSPAYEALAPHLYCAANPITFTDPTGLVLQFKCMVALETMKQTIPASVREGVCTDENLLLTKENLPDIECDSENYQIIKMLASVDDVIEVDVVEASTYLKQDGIISRRVRINLPSTT